MCCKPCRHHEKWGVVKERTHENERNHQSVVRQKYMLSITHLVRAPVWGASWRTQDTEKGALTSLRDIVRVQTLKAKNLHTIHIIQSVSSCYSWGWQYRLTFKTDMTQNETKRVKVTIYDWDDKTWQDMTRKAGTYRTEPWNEGLRAQNDIIVVRGTLFSYCLLQSKVLIRRDMKERAHWIPETEHELGSGERQNMNVQCGPTL